MRTSWRTALLFGTLLTACAETSAPIEVAAPLLFGRTEPALSVLAIEAIESTNCLAAVPDLIDALAGESDTVKSRAHGALSRLLGRDLDAEATAWREAYPHLLR